MKTKLLSVSFILLFGCVGFSQKSYSSTVTVMEYDVNGPKAEEGTFQFIITNSKKEDAFTTDVLYFIEQNRKEKEDVYMKISDFTDLYIPSRKKINDPSFVALEPISK